MPKIKKRLLIIIGMITLIVVIMFLCISPITKYLVQKYDEKLTGRKITMTRAYVNPLTGYVHFSNLKMYEYNSDSVFISMDGLSANFRLFDLFSKSLKLSSVVFNRPVVRIIKRESDFNFNDFRKHFPRKASPGKVILGKKSKKPLHFYFLKVIVNEGHFYYLDKATPVNFSIKNVNIESTNGWRWDKDTISANVSFLSEIGTGGMDGNFGMNLKSLFYELDVVVDNFDLDILEQYLNEIANYGTFSATFDADVETDGCFREAENINIKGALSINDLHFGKNPAEDYLSFDKVVFKIDDVNPQEQRYFFDSVLLYHPYFMYERYDNKLDNVRTMFVKPGHNVLVASSGDTQFNLIFIIGNWVKKLAKNFFRSDFNINRLAVYKADLKFNDYSLSEKFALELSPLTITADSLDKDRPRVNATLESMVKPYGKVSVFLSINPRDTGDFDLEYHIVQIPITIFNPYLISYTSFPLDRGTLELNGNWTVRNSSIQSTNHVVIIDPSVTKRIRNRDNKWLPLPLIMSFVREKGNVIDYEIPISGNFDNPKFHLNDAIFDLIENFFVKPPTTPYQYQVKNVETELEKSLTVKWKMRQSSLLPSQEKFIKKMADFLVKNPEATITVHPETYTIKEKEYILFFEAKKIYYLLSANNNSDSFNDEDLDKVEKMSAKDSDFVNYLDKLSDDSLMFTIQQKCSLIVDSAKINAKFEKLLQEREKTFISYFKEREVDDRVKISSSKNVIPYNGFSFYKIEYKGEYPASIIKAYNKMNELNNEAPRKKLLAERKRTKE